MFYAVLRIMVNIFHQIQYNYIYSNIFTHILYTVIFFHMEEKNDVVY